MAKADAAINEAVTTHRLEAHATNIVPDIGLVRLPGRNHDHTGIEIRVRRGAYLPHWTCEGGIYAVTFRLADSLPQSVLSAWQRERDDIMRRSAHQQRPLTAAEVQQLSALHTDRVEKCLDRGYGVCHLNDERIASLVRNALLHFDGQRYDLVVWCIMPNHVHAVVHPRADFDLPHMLHSWKSFTAKEANHLLSPSGAFWQPEPYDHLIRDEEDYRHQVEYILTNPTAAGLKNWPWVGRGTGFQPVTNAIFHSAAL